MHVIVCGGRERLLTDDDITWLEAQRQRLDIVKVYHGGATGIDTDAGAWALQHGLEVEAIPADWDAHRPADPLKGNPAGIIRNNRMLKRLREQCGEHAIAVLAFAGGDGTADMCAKARKAGVLVFEPPPMSPPSLPPSNASTAILEVFGGITASPTDHERIGMAASKTTPTEQTPLLQTPGPLSEEAPLLASPMPDVDDIPEPVLPEVVLTAMANPPPPTLPPLREDWLPMLQGFCQHLQHRIDADVMEHHRGVMQALDAVCHTVKTWMEGIVQHNEHAQYQFSDALLKLQEQGLQVRHAPYHGTIQAVSSHGFLITIQTDQESQEALTTEMGQSMAWLAEHGCTAVPQAVQV